MHALKKSEFVSPFIARTLEHETLDREQEIGLALRVLDGDRAARAELVRLNQRLVAMFAKRYVGYGLSMDDLMQAGNVGLLDGIQRFDPYSGHRISTYVSKWIQAEIRDYVMRNFRLVIAATTQARQTLFFRLRSDEAFGPNISIPSIAAIAYRLQVAAADVECMVAYFAGKDISSIASEDDGRQDVFDHIADDQSSADAIEAKMHQANLESRVAAAISTLSERERIIITERFLNEDKAEKVTLSTLAKRFGISLERVRQIEAGALSKLAEPLEQFQ